MTCGPKKPGACANIWTPWIWVPGWLPIPTHMLSAVQKEHESQCGPYVMALECEETSLRLELLVRARGRIRCECVAYASPELQRHMMDYITDTLKELHIPT